MTSGSAGSEEARAARRETAQSSEEPPPIFGSWRVLYVLVLAELVGIVALCHWITVRAR